MTPDAQTPFDAAVVIPTVLRPTLDEAVRSVFAQDIAGRVQILIGIDRHAGARTVLDALVASCPSTMALTIVDPGYSTALANGGLVDVRCGGALRAALSLLANSRYVAYLDDDNRYAPDHLSSLRRAIDGAGWAWSLRRFVDGATGADLGEDLWDSRGPDAGTFADRGGLVDTSCLMIDAARCLDLVWRWARPSGPGGEWEDRTILRGLVAAEPGRGTGRATVHYRVNRDRQALLAARIAGAPPSARTRPGLSLAEVSRPLPPSPTAPTPAPVHDGYRTVIASIAARAIVDAGARDGTSTVELARAAGANATVVALDDWPADDPATFQAFVERVAGAGYAKSVRTMARSPLDGLAVLARLGVAVDLVRLGHVPDGRHEERLHDLLRTAWLVLRAGGALMVDAYTLEGDASLRGIGLFARPRGLTVYTAGAERTFVLVKR